MSKPNKKKNSYKNIQYSFYTLNFYFTIPECNILCQKCGKSQLHNFSVEQKHNLTVNVRSSFCSACDFFGHK